ncbi:MAG TPA: hypothetical protein VGL94_15170 [Ktedonobacteraceae bacterium]|jgi:hypothetical protein
MPVILPETLQEQLTHHGITHYDEVGLRQELEARVPTYTLIKLADWPARRWKCHYRLLIGATMHDAQSVPEAYALALLSIVQHSAQPQELETTIETENG